MPCNNKKINSTLFKPKATVKVTISNNGCGEINQVINTKNHVVLTMN